MAKNSLPARAPARAYYQAGKPPPSKTCISAVPLQIIAAFSPTAHGCFFNAIFKRPVLSVILHPTLPMAVQASGREAGSVEYFRDFDLSPIEKILHSVTLQRDDGTYEHRSPTARQHSSNAATPERQPGSLPDYVIQAGKP
ncbi:hypothetical protein ACTHGU_20130 [Chitinophagaceae bacterium MMS25-I14]